MSYFTPWDKKPDPVHKVGSEPFNFYLFMLYFLLYDTDLSRFSLLTVRTVKFVLYCYLLLHFFSIVCSKTYSAFKLFIMGGLILKEPTSTIGLVPAVNDFLYENDFCFIS